MPLWITPEEIIQLTGITPETIGLEDEDEEKLKELVTTWIEEAMSQINAYCGFKPDLLAIPPAVVNVCRRLVMNMVSFIIARNNTSLIQAQETKLGASEDIIFTKALKDDLAPFVQAGGGQGGDDDDKKSKKRWFIPIAITGEDLD